MSRLSLSSCRTLVLAAAAAAMLSACGGEPSEADIQAAYHRLADGREQGIAGLLGQDMAKLARTEIHGVKKIACKAASDKPGYVCDFQVDSESVLGRSQQAASARFVKGDDGWQIVP